MPPSGMPRPEPAAHTALVSYLETTLDREAAAHPNPGRSGPHRLNRAEYANAVRDLLSLDVDTATLLPPDDSAEGFDNIADVLGASPALLERYLSAAAKISALAVGVAFLAKTATLGDTRLQNFQRSTLIACEHRGLPHVESVTISGPFN